VMVAALAHRELPQQAAAYIGGGGARSLGHAPRGRLRGARVSVGRERARLAGLIKVARRRWCKGSCGVAWVGL
jgi:hypothetical protein